LIFDISADARAAKNLITPDRRRDGSIVAETDHMHDVIAFARGQSQSWQNLAEMPDARPNPGS
jgi:hypothetical protein